MSKWNYPNHVKTAEESCRDIQAAVDRGDKCELGETNKERLIRKAKLEKKNEV